MLRFGLPQLISLLLISSSFFSCANGKFSFAARQHRVGAALLAPDKKSLSPRLWTLMIPRGGDDGKKEHTREAAETGGAEAAVAAVEEAIEEAIHDTAEAVAAVVEKVVHTVEEVVEKPVEKTEKAAPKTTTTTTAATTLQSIASLSSVRSIVCHALKDLKSYMNGPKADTLLLLAITALNTPICINLLNGMLSPILGFLLLGVVLGPYGYNVVSDIHRTELLADIGVVLFLFEMGIHLNFATLMKMKKDVFGLGGAQMALTTLAIFGIGTRFFGDSISKGAFLILAGGLALSSSAFVLQLLKDKKQLNTRFGRSSFGILLLQDLAVVPLLVVTPLIAAASGGGEGGADVTTAIVTALIKAVMALGIIGFAGAFLLVPIFEFVLKSQSQDSIIGYLLGTILGMSFLTEGLGLSNTLGAFLAGVLLSDTNSKYDHKIEKEISPFRGILVGLFFFTVGFEIDVKFITSNWKTVMKIVSSILVLKGIIITNLCLLFGLPFSIAQRCGFILSQGGEFAFVAFRLARSYGILDTETTKLMLTCVSLTMAVTPFLESLGGQFATKLEAKGKSEQPTNEVGRRKKTL